MRAEGPWLETWRFWALSLWAIGVQAHEFLATLGMALLVLSFVPTGLRLRREGTLGHSMKPWWPLWAFIIWAIVAPTVAGHSFSGSGLARMLDWATIPLVASAAGALNARRFFLLGLFALITLGISSALAGFQYFGLWPQEHVFDSFRWLGIPFARVYEPLADSGHFMGGGLLFHRLKFGHISGLAVVSAVVAWHHSKSLAVLVLGIVGFWAVWVFPAARMAAIAMTFAVIVTAVFTLSGSKALWVTLGFIVALSSSVVVFVPSLRLRFESALTDQGSGQRMQHLGAGVEAVRQFPLTGVGVGQFRPSKFGGPEMAEHVKDNPGKTHNQFLSMAAETGIPGGLGFIALLIWLSLSARGKPLAPLAWGALVLFTLLSLAHDPLFQAPFSMALVLALGLGLSSFAVATPRAHSAS